MTRLLWSVILVVVGLTVTTSAADGPEVLYVQLIQGNDADASPSAESKAIGPKLAGKLRRIFRFRSYWEMNHKEIAVTAGRQIRVALNKTREVEIDLSNPENRKVTVYKNGKPLSAITTPVGQEMTITGGDRNNQSVWFIVVRQDKPSIE